MKLPWRKGLRSDYARITLDKKPLFSFSTIHFKLIYTFVTARNCLTTYQLQTKCIYLSRGVVSFIFACFLPAMSDNEAAKLLEDYSNAVKKEARRRLLWQEKNITKRGPIKLDSLGRHVEAFLAECADIMKEYGEVSRPRCLD